MSHESKLDLDKIERAIQDYPFAEANLVRAAFDSLLLKDGKVHQLESGSEVSIGFRVLINGSWGLASTNSSDVGSWKGVLKRAEKLARANPRPMKSRLSDEKVCSDKWVVKAKRSPLIDMEDKIKELRDIYKSTEIKDEIKATEISLTNSSTERIYFNSEGAEIVQKAPRALLSFSATAKEKIVISASKKFAGLYGMEILDGKGDALQEAVNNSVRLLNSEKSPSGKFPVVVDYRMAGVLAHEAMGHACEADEVVNDRSILKGKLGQRIGSDLVTIIDNPTLTRAFGTYAYDWEGVPARKTVLVENGILKSFLHSRETAAEMDAHSTGNCRAEDPSSFPLVRMSNTYFEKGDASFDELIEDIKLGIYVHGMKGGVTDPLSGFFQFAAEYGELIEDGQITKPLRDVTIAGSILETLHQVGMVGEDWRGNDPGFCGKSGQSVPVSDGGPSLKLEEVLVG